MSAIDDFNQAATDYIAAAISALDPSDAVRCLSRLAQFATPQGTGAVGDVIARRLRQASVIGLCEILTNGYRYSSLDDALAKLSLVSGLLDSAIADAATANATSTYSALYALKSRVVQTMRDAGASLVPLKTFTLNASLPSLALAQFLYRDGGRSDDIVARSNPVCPLFCDRTVTVLAR